MKKQVCLILVALALCAIQIQPVRAVAYENLEVRVEYQGTFRLFIDLEAITVDFEGNETFSFNVSLSEHQVFNIEATATKTDEGNETLTLLFWASYYGGFPSALYSHLVRNGTTSAYRGIVTARWSCSTLDIPAFPFESIVIGLVLAFAAVYLLRRKRPHRLDYKGDK